MTNGSLPADPDTASLVNVALGSRATQSSRSPWSGPDEATAATAGRMPADFAFHTAVEDAPWFELDLGGAVPVEAVVVHNRLLDCQERARTLRVELAEEPGRWVLVHAGYARFGGRGHGRPLALWLGGDVRARYLRLSLGERQPLHLAQVEVFARPELVALEAYARRHGLAGFTPRSTDFGRPYGLAAVPGAPLDRVVGLRLSYAGRFGNLALQYSHMIELARRTGLAFVQLGRHELFDLAKPVAVDGLTLLPADAPLPADGLFITGSFFDTGPFAPVLPPFMRFDPADEAFYAGLARRVLRPHLLTGVPLPDERHPADEVTIHLRSGDLFGQATPDAAYRQPPLSFYRLAVDRLRAEGLVTRARLVFEDRGNPCVDALEAWLAAEGLPCRLQQGTLTEDLSALIDAPHLVFGHGTFGYAACRLSGRIETVHFFAPELGGRYAAIPQIARVVAVSDRDGRYIRAGEWGSGLPGEWRNTPEQRRTMLDYPASALRVDEVRRAGAASSQTERPRPADA